MKRWTTLLATALCALMMWQGAALADEIPTPDKRPTVATFKGKTLKNKRVRSKDFEGKVVIVNFWATWCGPCKQELPFLSEFAKKYKDQGLVVLAVATDGPETAAKVPSVSKRLRLGMPVVMDTDGAVTAALNPRGNNPFTVYVDRNGKVAKAHEGFAPGDEKGIEALIQKLLAEKATK